MDGLSRLVYPIDHVEITDSELVAIQSGEYGIPRERMSGGHFGQRFYRVEDTHREAGRTDGIAVGERHNVCDFSNVVFSRFGYLDTITHTQILDGL